MTSILVDICHPAHAHFFRHPISIWRDQGCIVHLTARDKDVALPLLHEFGLDCVTFGRTGRGALSLLNELVRRDLALLRHVKSVGAQVATAVGGIFAAHAAWAARIPSVVFYDTEIATLQNLLTYPIASVVAVPRCYSGWTPADSTVRYDGYHELSYLSPSRFTPDRARALAAGLSAERPTYLARTVSWTANHDFGDFGLPPDVVRYIVARLQALGEVVISSERTLPEELEPLRFKGRASDMHHLMAFCHGYFGESATMASECAVLGVPAVYAANSRRGYTDEQESRYGLVRYLPNHELQAISASLDWLAGRDRSRAILARERLLSESLDVATFIAETVVSAAGAGRNW
jgi:predicted glycosyltransferase